MFTSIDPYDPIVQTGVRPARRKCAHAQQTLCQYDDDLRGHIVAYQCDACGMVTRRDVSADDLERPNLPWLDNNLWCAAIAAGTDRIRGVSRIVALTFIARAVLR
jgi:hypothetical protein